MCLIDLCFIKNKEMILHHVIVLALLHFMNTTPDSEHKHEIVCYVLSTEISTTFLITNNLLDKNKVVLKNINKVIFIFTFFYYRIYNYSYLLLDDNFQNTLTDLSKNKFEYCEIFGSLYGLLFLNLYWACLILKKCIN